MRLLALRLLTVLALLLTSAGSGAASTIGPVSATGSIDGAAFKIEIPANWNGTLVLYSHGYVVPGSANLATDVGDPVTRQYLLSQGFALAGSSYKSTGWAVQDALVDQIALLDHFSATYGKPERTIAWGHSLGGMITAGLVQRHPDRFAGALPMCGVLAGGVGVWNSSLDAEFVFKTLVAPTLQLVNIANPPANLGAAEGALAAAQATPQGRARVALAAAVSDLPGWFSPLLPESAANQFADREQNQFLWDSRVDFPFLFALRAEMEARAGGNPSWNTHVDYGELLERSVNRDEVQALYAAAGLSLDHDLATLAAAPRISADPRAVRYLTRNIVYNGELDDVPVLTMHTTGDGLVLNQDEQAYASIVDDRDLLRQTFVHRAGHCTFTPAETIAAFNSLLARINTHRWPELGPEDLNAAAQGLGPQANVLLLGPTTIVPTAPAFLNFTPTAFPRPFSLEDRHER
ncbi:MAG TPA: alpha/beta hydrolase [Chloroflexota bacterium]|nr:alpha/beta hydrolase [Chloroflexota bacterium]